MNNLGEFKCPSCGWVHVAISLEDAEVQVRQAEAFYVVAGKIDHVTMRGPTAYLEGYKRCYKCGATAGDFVPAVPGDAPDGCTLHAVIAPNTLKRSSLLDSAEALHRVGALTDAEMGLQQAVIAPRMSEYEFTLKYLMSSDDTNFVELLERLGVGGCTDSLVGIGEPGCIALEFTREAESLRDARESAIADVKRAIPSATFLDDRAQLNDFQVPDDFPRPRHLGVVPGAQPKFLGVEYEGRYYSPGCTPPELHERWQHCMQYVPQFITSCIETKAGKRAHMPEAAILDQYLVRLIDAGWCSDDEARWVIRETAKLLGWPMPAAANGET
ncbi:hypothetical protein ACFDR9_000556 [Janthinobacterium sp. CG_23.3]|uniref:hypothetical protein n=1 Tax=Janthinobacterium sp. CG_23.3 TaxID=3349634 RepID=UPI0038D493B4